MTPERAIREGICQNRHTGSDVAMRTGGRPKSSGANDIARSKPIELAQTLDWATAWASQNSAQKPLAAFLRPVYANENFEGEFGGISCLWIGIYLRVSSFLSHPSRTMYHGLSANLEWEEMVDGRRFEPRPRNQWTGASIFDCQSGSLRVCQRISDHINAGQALTYDFLLAYEHRVNERLGLVAPCLLQRDHILERDDRVAWERIMLTIGLNNRCIRLHRRYMLRGYTVLEYRGSTEKCINAAKSMLHIYQEAQSIDFPGITWWVVCMHSFAAAVVLLMDQFYARTAVGGETPPPAEMETRRRHIFQAISLLSVVGNTNNLARRAARVLAILADELARRRHTFSPPDLHPSLSTSLHISAMDRLRDHPGDAHLGSWVSAGLGPATVPDAELQAAPVSVRGMPPEIEAFWTRVFELDLPVAEDPRDDRSNH
ncbi:hypothetical protein RHS01_03479 [Rhizoctonia solani]|uniref:Transcription factor domain-containing protein n=1 Tax=Rhizoctonia solani TaxID=456999 RepID=A0A8H7IFC1_9AGAM|nr:hypothetical protein RHS01_03479 [Rhizoctonia solani]